MHSQCGARHPHPWDGRLASRFILIKSKPHIFHIRLPSKHTAKFTNPYYRVDFSWVRTSLSVCKDIFIWYRGLPAVVLQSREPKKAGERVSECLQMPYRSRGGGGRGGRGGCGVKEQISPKQLSASLICGGDQTVA